MPEQIHNIVQDTVIKGKHRRHDPSHNERRDHDRHIHDRTNRVATAEFLIDEHCQQQSQNVLQEAASDAVDQGIDGRSCQARIFEQSGKVRKPNESHVFTVAVP